MKKILLIFIIAFALNFIWENLHMVLYDNFRGGPISRFILFQASVADAFYIVLLALPFLYLKFFKERRWLIIILGICLAVLNEWFFGLYLGWWQYAPSMPIIPILKTGLSPTIQLGILGYTSLVLVNFCYPQHSQETI